MEPRTKRAYGGTRFIPVLDSLELNPPDVLVWITDCVPMDAPVEPMYPVIFLNTDPNGKHYHKSYLDFGELVDIY